MVTIRKLQPGDEQVLTTLAADAVDFGMSDAGTPLAPLTAQQASEYLQNPAVLHFVAFENAVPVGTMVAIKLPLPVSPGIELLLHEIGVRESHRRQGIGSALLRALDDWMVENGIETVWLLSDGEGAEHFYTECGFDTQSDQPIYMLRSAFSE